jgi:hypothetical protein
VQFRARRDSVQELIRDTRSTIVCIQETKLAAFDSATILRTLGPKFLNNVAILPMINTRGGILLAASNDFSPFRKSTPHPYVIPASITMKVDNLVRSMACSPMLRSTFSSVSSKIVHHKDRRNGLCLGYTELVNRHV